MNWITNVLVAVLLLGAAACVGSGKYQMKEQEAAASMARAEDAEATLAACRTRVTECDARSAQAEATAKTLQARLDEVTASRDSLQAQAAALSEQKGAAEATSAEYASLAGSLQEEIQNGQIEISELRERMTVKLKDKILFPSGSAKLSREGKAALEVVAGVFKDLQGKNVLVAGFTDDVRVSSGGRFEDNWHLSSARALAVVRYLASKGVPPQMLGAAAFSEFRPVAPNDSPENRSMNRRIEIALTPSDYQPLEVEVR